MTGKDVELPGHTGVGGHGQESEAVFAQYI